MKLSQFRALTFDCYGTLIDWESGIWDALQPVIAANARDDLTRQETLQTYAETESAQQSETPDMLYPDLLQQVFGSLCKRLNLDRDDALTAEFGASVAHWPAFPDTADALRRLKKHFKLIILSNVDRQGFAASNRKLGVEFDAIYTAQDVGSYKPDHRNFDYMLEHLDREFGLGQDDILHTAQSLFHDHVPATAFGLVKAWIDRQHLAGSQDWGATAKVAERPQVDFIFPTMAAMADAVDAERN